MFETHRRHCVESLSKFAWLVTVQPKTENLPDMTENLLTNRASDLFLDWWAEVTHEAKKRWVIF